MIFQQAHGLIVMKGSTNDVSRCIGRRLFTMTDINRDETEEKYFLYSKSAMKLTNGIYMCCSTSL